MQDHKFPSPFRMAIVPGLITLAVTITRLVGELTGGPTLLFGDPTDPVAIVGITWLALLFGGCFGIKLRSLGQGPRSLGRPMALVLIGLLLGVLVGTLGTTLDLVILPGTLDAEGNPREPSGFLYLVIAAALPGAAAWIAWPQLAKTLLVYAALARIPVVVVTGVCLVLGLDGTHYTALPGPVPDSMLERFVATSLAQVTLWPLFTIAMGTVVGLLAARLTPTREGMEREQLETPGTRA